MSGNENNDAVMEEASNDASTIKSNKSRSQRNSKLAIVIALFSLFLTILVIIAAVYFYKQNQQLTITQQENIAQLKSQNNALSSYSQQATSIKNSLEKKVEQTNRQLQRVENASKQYRTDMQAMQRALAATKVRRPNDWVLSEVEYLVNLAGRKIWLEKDISSATALLLAADQRVVELSDASLSVLRSAFLEDMNTLEALPKLDPDGMVLALSALERRIDKLAITGLEVSHNQAESPEAISSDINDWQNNLSATWSNFVNSFIVINKRDSKLEALLSPEQSWYLKENIRHDLEKAELAVYREQQAVYVQALNNALNLLKNYYNLKDGATKHFYQSIQDLKNRNVSIDYPDQLKSAPILKRIIEQRIKKSLASSRVEQE